MTNKCIEAIEEARKCGRLNPYMIQKLLRVVKDGMTNDLTKELIEDAQNASDAGVNGDRDYNVYFFIGRFADDILDDTFGMKIGPNRKKDLCHYIMSHKDDKNYKLDDLTDYRLLIHKWLCDRLSKKAYPNIAGKSDRSPIYDVDKWIGTLKKIYAALHLKQSDKQESINHFTSEWDQDEKQKFINWMRYYENGTTEKYNVKTAKFIKQAFEPEMPVPQSWVNREDRESDSMNMSTRKQKREQTRREKELDKAKQFKLKMRSRLRSFKRLVERYNDILGKQDLDKVYDELFNLEKSVSKLDIYASLQDCVIRSANRLEKFGFTEGAEFLKECAEEPVAEKDIIQPKEPDLPPQASQMAGLQPIISKLEEISKSLKSRDMIRELASIDISLNELGLASFFPELSFAQGKLIESFGYSSTKIEDIISKLRGSGPSADHVAPPGDQTKPWGAYKKPSKSVKKPPELPVPAPAVPPKPPIPKPIDTGEILSKPVTKVEEKLPTR